MEMKETKTKATKDKRRNNEKRKEKSRDAARCRRSRETEIFADLASALPITQDQVSQLDKASIMRLAISFLRVNDMINILSPINNLRNDLPDDNSSIFLKSLEGFLLVLSHDGDFVYLSENVTDYLGIQQIDLMGQNIYDYSHPCDHDEIKELLSLKTKDDNGGNDGVSMQKSFFIRLKCTLTSKGRSVNLKSASYKVLHCTGHMLRSRDEQCSTMDDKKLRNCFAAIAQPIPHPSNIEAPLPKQTFVTKHSLDMKFVHADDNIMKEVLGYEEDELLGKSVYEYHHAMDSDAICSAYKCLFSKGQCETSKYRFLAKNGGFVWVLTQATLIYDKMQKPQSVVCINFVISGIECENEIYSAVQLSSTSCVNNNNNNNDKQIDSNSNVLPLIIIQRGEEENELKNNEEEGDDYLEYLNGEIGPKRNTQKILNPRTKEMSSGFLTFTEDSGSTMLKDEPEDLTHLAPVAGDACVPLEDHPFLSDVLDDLLLRDNFSPLMMDEPSDPFISYRETYDVSPELLSPNLTKNSDSTSVPSLSSPSNSLGDDDHLSSFMNYQIDDEKNDCIRSGSPAYIPINMDDLPLLLTSSNDLMWSTPSASSPTRKESSLAQLLSTKTTPTSERHGQWSNRRTTNNKRSSNFNSSNISSKRVKTEQINEKMSSELLQQLISNNSNSNNNNNRTRSKKSDANWILDGQKAACISQPSESVLMNLLGSDESNVAISAPSSPSNLRRYLIKVNSKSLLYPENRPITSLLTLTDKDFEVNAPVNNNLLQGEDLIRALDICDRI